MWFRGEGRVRGESEGGECERKGLSTVVCVQPFWLIIGPSRHYLSLV